MKKILFVVFLITYYQLLITGPAFALTPTPTITPTPTKAPAKSAAETQINQLKDRIASRVAELKLVERRGMIGKVTQVSQTQITISDIKNNTRFVDVDELTKFASPSAEDSFGISDIKEGSTIGVLGLYNKQSRRLLSRFVDVLTFPTTLHGAVGAIDDEEFVIDVMTEDGKVTPVDIETVTKTTSYDKDAESTKAGFSKIKEGMRVVVVGFPSKTDTNRITATRILLFPDTPKNPKIKLDASPTTLPTPTESGQTSTKSAR